MDSSPTQHSVTSLLAIALLGCSGSVDGLPGDGVGTVQQRLSSRGWLMGSHDVVASNHDADERHIGRDNVGDLVVKWVFDGSTAGQLVGPVHGTPVVGGNKVYFGTALGQFYAVDRDGNMLWQYTTKAPNPLLGAVFKASRAPVVGSAVLPNRTNIVVFADLDGNVYALDRDTGSEVWVKPDLDPHPLGGVLGNSMLLFGDTLVIGMSSVENAALGIPGYPCCTHRGFAVALDVNTGAERWRHYTVEQAGSLGGAFGPKFPLGPSGADIWSQPTYDEETNTVFIGTGQNFSPRLSATPPFSTSGSDAIIALDASTGEEKWKRQLIAGDIWVDGIPNPNVINPQTGLPLVPFARVGFLDLDVGDSPKVYRLADGTKVVAAGQKSGAYQVLDAATGSIVASTTHIQVANGLGGFQTGGAFAGDTAFQHGLAGLDATGKGPYLGTVMALSLDGTQVKWHFDHLLSPMAAPIAVANDVVYVVSPADELASLDPTRPKEWAIYGLDAADGKTLLRTSFAGRAMSAPVVDNGRVYVGKGNTAIPSIGVDINGGILALGRPE